jgi:hypothetical protein
MTPKSPLPSARSETEPLIIFLHIQKNAGSTLYHVLLRNYGPGLLRRNLTRFRGSASASSSIRQTVAAAGARSRFVAGHFCYGVHTVVPRPYRYIALFREPVSRLVSLYDYSAHNPHAYYHRHAQGKSLEEFLLGTDLMELDNGQVRFAAGGSDDFFINRTPIGQCSRALLEIAQSNIRNDFLEPGLVERFDESLLLLQRALGWKTIRYSRRNRGRSAIRTESVSEHTLERIRQRNLLDVQLYDWLEERFNARVESLGSDFAAQLRAFKRANRRRQLLLEPIVRPYENLARLLAGWNRSNR